MSKSTLRNAAILVASVFLCSLWFGCSDDPTDPEGGRGGIDVADSTASHWMQELSESLEELPAIEDMDEDDLRDLDISGIRDGMDAALAANPSSPAAHLGSGILDVVELNYNNELWAYVDSALAFDDRRGGVPIPGVHLGSGSRILRNQFTLLATAPREIARRSMNPVPANLTIATLQQLVEDEMIPALNSAIDHMALAEAGEVAISITVEDETHEIDLGEVYLFDAALHAARAGLLILIAYDYDLPGADGTNAWMDPFLEYSDNNYNYYADVIPLGIDEYKLRYITSNEGEVRAEELLLQVLQHNHDNRPAFLERRGTHMADAYQDLLTMRDRLESAVESIRGEDDAQENDIVRIADLIDADSEVWEFATDTGHPNFATNWTTVDDALAWVEQVMTGTYSVSEEGDNGLIEIDVNLSNFFNNAPQNWRDLLPYFEFTPQQGWVEQNYMFWWSDPSEGTQCYTDIDGVFQCQDNVVEIEYGNLYWELVDPIQLLDELGEPIDMDLIDVPYFPDYTMAGLFPGATRQTWLDISDAW